MIMSRLPKSQYFILGALILQLAVTILLFLSGRTALMASLFFVTSSSILVLGLSKSLTTVTTTLQQKTQEAASRLGELEETKKQMTQVLADLRNEKANMEKEKAKDEALLESIGDGLVATSPDGRVLVVNHATEELFGFAKDELIGKRFYEIIPMADARGELIKTEDRPMKIALTEDRKISSSDYFLFGKGTRKFPAAITVAPVHLNGEIIAAIGIYRDISHEKDVDRMKTEFISLASHQLRTPLSAIKWFAELLSDSSSSLSSEQNDFVQNIALSTERMIELVNSLLNVSRIESGRIIIDPKPTDLVALVKNLLLELEGKIKEKHHRVIVTAHEQLPEITIDPKLVRQVYMNLLTNAIKYTPDYGEIEVAISKNDTDIISRVSDNGYGIPQANKEKLFQKFYRAENVVKIEPDGNGLGLYLVKAIIESSGGKVWFESQENKGTTFYFSLPLSGSVRKPGEVTINS